MSQPYPSRTAGFLANEASDKTTVVVVYALYLAGFVTAGLTPLIGLVMIYALRGRASDIARSHYVFLARTFWIGTLWFTLATLLLLLGLTLSLILIGIPMLLAAKLIFLVTAVWYAVRCVIGLLAAMADRPHLAPRTWLV